MTKQLDFNLELFNLSNSVSMAVEAVGDSVATLGVEEISFTSAEKNYKKFTRFLNSLTPESSKEMKTFLSNVINEITENVSFSIYSEDFKTFMSDKKETFVHERYNVPITKTSHGFIIDLGAQIEEYTLLTAPKIKTKKGDAYRVYDNAKLEKFLLATVTHDVLLRLEGHKFRLDY